MKVVFSQNASSRGLFGYYGCMSMTLFCVFYSSYLRSGVHNHRHCSVTVFHATVSLPVIKACSYFSVSLNLGLQQLIKLTVEWSHVCIVSCPSGPTLPWRFYCARGQENTLWHYFGGRAVSVQPFVTWLINTDTDSFTFTSIHREYREIMWQGVGFLLLSGNGCHSS